MSKRNGKYKTCTVCGDEYYIRADRAESSKWCSQECWANRRELKDCEYCGNPITSYHAEKYCSRDCAQADMVKEKHPQWKGGVSLTNERARNSTELKKWRKKVFKRDNYTCQHCGDTGHIHAHHIIPFSESKDKRFDVSNGLTLCVHCHGEVHGKDFTERAKNYCPDCGDEIKRESDRCSSCAAKHHWKKRRVEA